MDQKKIVAIKEFWNFFEEISNELLLDLENFELITKLDEKVIQFLDLGWEYGPTSQGMYFCLSPSYDYDLLDYTKFAISLAPNLPNWKFIAGKPQKPEEIEEFVIYDDNNAEIKIVTSDWRAVVYKFKDGTFDVDVLMNNSLPKNLKDLALDIALTNMIGEINYMKKINKAQVVENFDDGTNKKGFEFCQLSKVVI